VGVAIVNQDGEPLRLGVDGGHPFVMQLDLTGDLDCDYGNNNQHHEQYEATQKTHGASLTLCCSFKNA
jgi:hypothetical protein